MGMFTSIVHEGRDYQIKTGWDYCDFYEVGETIPWQPDENLPGYHIDDVYVGEGATNRALVAIVNQAVAEVFLLTSDDHRILEELVVALKRKHGITEPDRSLWSDEAWEADAKRKEANEAKYQAWLAENGTGDEACDATAYHMHLTLGQKSFIEQILPEVPVGEED